MLAGNNLMGFIPTRDPARARSFYEGVLGLTFVSEDSFAVTVASDGNLIRLVRIDNHVPVKFTILGWQTENIDKAVANLNARGVTFEKFGMPDQDSHGIWTSPGGGKVAWFSDPDGNILSLAQLPGE